LEQYPGTFICIDPFRYTGAERLQEDDDDKHGRARNQEKDSRFTFDLAWATTLLRCCSSLVVLLCYRSTTGYHWKRSLIDTEAPGQVSLCREAGDGIDRDSVWIKSDLQRRSWEQAASGSSSAKF
jgi:hypothetical protein